MLYLSKLRKRLFKRAPSLEAQLAHPPMWPSLDELLAPYLNVEIGCRGRSCGKPLMPGRMAVTQEAPRRHGGGTEGGGGGRRCVGRGSYAFQRASWSSPGREARESGEPWLPSVVGAELAACSGRPPSGPRAAPRHGKHADARRRQLRL